jgi:hypothetical protein
MSDESSPGSRRASDGRGPHGRGAGEQSPLQARTQFLKDWSRELVTSFNRGACERGKAQYGINCETQEAITAKWEHKRAEPVSHFEIIAVAKEMKEPSKLLFCLLSLSVLLVSCGSLPHKSCSRWLGIISNGDKPGTGIVVETCGSIIERAFYYVLEPEDLENLSRGAKFEMKVVKQEGLLTVFLVDFGDGDQQSIYLKVPSGFYGKSVSGELLTVAEQTEPGKPITFHRTER